MITKIYKRTAHRLALFTILYSLFTVLVSCADLDQTSISSIDKDNFYQSKNDIETAINGIYQEFTVNGMYGIWNNQTIYLQDLQTDYVRAGAQTNSAHIREVANFAVQPTNLFVVNAWEAHYTAINRANVVIDKVTTADWLDEQSKQNYIAEARFLRAYTYFNLVRYFGGVPLVLHDGEGEGASRNTVDEVYEQIVSDFTAAEQLPANYTTLDSKVSYGPRPAARKVRPIRTPTIRRPSTMPRRSSTLASIACSTSSSTSGRWIRRTVRSTSSPSSTTAL